MGSLQIASNGTAPRQARSSDEKDAPSPPAANVHVPDPARKDSHFDPPGLKIRLLDAGVAVVGLVDKLFGTPANVKAAPFLDANADLRDGASEVWAARAAGKAPSAKAVAKLASQGFDEESVPRPGSMLVDPRHGGSLRVDGSKLSRAAPPLEARDPLTTMFDRKTPYRFMDSSGQLQSFSTPEAYCAYVAQQRAQAGLPTLDGKPIGMQFNLGGGGGKWKRFAPVMAEAAQLGIVPVSVAGASSGALAASFIAAGADPYTLAQIINDPRAEDITSPTWNLWKGGVIDGKVMHDFVRDGLAKVAAANGEPHEGPTLFRDLKMPYQTTATVEEDSQPQGSLKYKQNRTFVFSPLTTEDTEVALAAQSASACPVAFRPVHLTDPVSGRSLTLVDGGVLDNLPVGYGPAGLPQLDLAMDAPGDDLPHKEPHESLLPKGNIHVDNIVSNALSAESFVHSSDSDDHDFKDRLHPGKGEHALSIPTWLIADPKEQDTGRHFGHSSFDVAIDAQDREVARKFLVESFAQLTDPQASSANATDQLPTHLSFEAPVTLKGRHYRASYEGGERIRFQAEDGKKGFSINVPRKTIESAYLDAKAFGGFAPTLAAWAHQMKRQDD